MIRHCVFIRFRADVSQAEKDGIWADIRALKAMVPGYLAAYVGNNVSPETGMDKGFSEGFVIDFEGSAARDAYLVHPDHEKAGGRIVAAAEGGVAGIFVYDIEV
jgi:hypothetical protein